MLDEYERALFDLKSILQKTDEINYSRLADPETTDEDCRSIQTVMSHVVGAGFSYSNYFRRALSIDLLSSERKPIPYSEIIGEVDKMFAYTIETFEGKWEMTDKELTDAVINSSWGVTYDIEQLLEHAIVHILRHRRQIEKFLQKFETEV